MEEIKKIPDLNKLQIGTTEKQSGVLHIALEERTDCVVVKAFDGLGEGWTLLKINNDDKFAQGPAYVPDELHVVTDKSKDSVVVFG